VAIKDSAEGWVRGKPVVAMVVVAVVGIVVGGVIGLGVGFKVEQSRTRKDVQRLQQKIKDKGVVNPAAPIHTQVVSVTSSSAGTLVVRTAKRGQETIHTAATTAYEKTASAATADIAVGKRVLISKGAKDVIILSPSSKLGRVVASVGSDSFTVANAKGKQAKVKLSDVQKVYTLAPATAADVKAGSVVLAGGRGAGASGFAAVEIIVLPTGTAFVS